MKTTMSKRTLIMTLIATSVASMATTVVNAATDEDKSYKIFVYQDCQKLDEIQMNQTQIAAYQKLNDFESTMRELEVPVEEMEEKLASYEQEFEQLSDKIVEESEDAITVNKAMIKQHEKIAKKMQAVVRAHQKDIGLLEKQASVIQAAAHQFEQAIKPSIEQYKHKNITINIGSEEPNWQCSSDT